MTEVGVEPTLHRFSTCRLCRLAYPVVQLQTWELNPASRLMRPGRAPARLQCDPLVVTVGFEPTLSTF